MSQRRALTRILLCLYLLNDVRIRCRSKGLRFYQNDEGIVACPRHKFNLQTSSHCSQRSYPDPLHVRLLDISRYHQTPLIPVLSKISTSFRITVPTIAAAPAGDSYPHSPTFRVRSSFSLEAQYPFPNKTHVARSTRVFSSFFASTFRRTQMGIRKTDINHQE